MSGNHISNCSKGSSSLCGNYRNNVDINVNGTELAVVAIGCITLLALGELIVRGNYKGSISLFDKIKIDLEPGGREASDYWGEADVINI